MPHYDELKKLADNTSTASVSDILAKLGHTYQHDMHGVTLQTPQKKLFGQAVTLRSLPTRPDLIADLQKNAEDRIHMPFELALEATTSGKVLVIDSSVQQKKYYKL